MRVTHLIVMGLLLAVTGCAGNGKGRDVTAPSAPSISAEQALASAKLQLPKDATEVTIDTTGYREFRNVARVRFTAPRASVVAMCQPAWIKKIFSLSDYQKDLLGGPAAEGDQLCVTSGADGRGVSALVLIPASDPAHIRVAVYELPIR